MPQNSSLSVRTITLLKARARLGILCKHHRQQIWLCSNPNKRGEHRNNRTEWEQPWGKEGWPSQRWRGRKASRSRRGCTHSTARARSPAIRRRLRPPGSSTAQQPPTSGEYSKNPKQQSGEWCIGRDGTATVRPRKMSSDATRFDRAGRVFSPLVGGVASSGIARWRMAGSSSSAQGRRRRSWLLAIWPSASDTGAEGWQRSRTLRAKRQCMEHRDEGKDTFLHDWLRIQSSSWLVECSFWSYMRPKGAVPVFVVFRLLLYGFPLTIIQLRNPNFLFEQSELHVKASD